jgi:hypothetical protein
VRLRGVRPRAEELSASGFVDGCRPFGVHAVKPSGNTALTAIHTCVLFASCTATVDSLSARDRDAGLNVSVHHDAGLDAAISELIDAGARAISVEEFCRRAKRMLTASWARCWGGAVEDWAPLNRAEETCRELAASVAAGHIAFDAIAAEHCLLQMQEGSCDYGNWSLFSYSTWPMCSRIFTGLIAPGESCEFGECAEGAVCDAYHNVTGNCTHTCIPRGTLTVGSTCTWTAVPEQCQLGASCRPLGDFSDRGSARLGP